MFGMVSQGGRGWLWCGKVRSGGRGESGSG